jgi:hypothetical protein
MATFTTALYSYYNSAYNDIVSQINGSTVLNAQQKADCLQALLLIQPPIDPTGTAPVSNPGTGTSTPVIVPPPVYNPQTPSNFSALP